MFLTACSCSKESPFLNHKGDPTATTTTAEANTVPHTVASGVTWYHEYDSKFLENAMAQNKMIILYFYADGCPWCDRQDKMFTDPEIVKLLTENFICYKLDTDTMSPSGLGKMRIRGVPTVIIIIPGETIDDTIYKGLDGYKDVAIMTAYLERAVEIKYEEEMKNIMDMGN